jgi:SnoaL-like protein
MSAADLHPVPAWAHGNGFLELAEAEPLSDPAQVADRLLIVERVHRYCWSYDERRLELLRDCFTPDGIWEGNVMGEIPIGPFVGAEEITRWMTEFWPVQRDQRRHMILNAIMLEQGPEEATALTYLLLTGAKDSSVRVETTGFYRTRMRKDGGRWRIAHLFAGFDAPFWPGKLEQLSERGRARHGIRSEASR